MHYNFTRRLNINHFSHKLLCDFCKLWRKPMPFKQKFTETKLTTKFGEFNIRVYPDNTGKEVFALWKEPINQKEPTLVRVHSECITGDMLGSLHCDCGKQLSKSLEIINKEGGIVIYLRQEGRGIGLFEKMKTYQLQSNGYDTFEANTLLGHKPDLRSYEMVKTVLDDFHIQKIRLLTNNPSKVSDIAKLGIEVIEQVPLISRANKHNKKYLETKKNKFQHFIKKSTHSYFYQFNVDSPELIPPIITFIEHRKKDPLLKIGIGITANSQSLTNTNEIIRINKIIKLCENHKTLSPVIHFSFENSSDTSKDAAKIKELWPSIIRLQVNDLKTLNSSTIKKLCEFFSINLPLSNDNFDIIQDTEIRKILKKNKSFIMLDNSKGNGIEESKDSFTNKIDLLLSYGLNNIFLCGGFGPNKLETYFEIKRYYRINFSIDAEKNLKTNNKIDIEKIKSYLSQLIRFDDPKQEGINQTRKFLEEHRRTEWENTEINGYKFSIHSKVFHAGLFPSSSWFASELCTLLKNDSHFCEIGCGSGVISCLTALSNPKLEITATDINPHATENTEINATQLNLLHRIKTFTGDVLDSIEATPQFDSIFWALPFGFLDPGIDISFEEAQVFDPGYRAIRKFFQTAKLYLKPNGRLLIGFSSDLGHPDLLEEIAKENSFKLIKLKETMIKENVDVKFEILEARLSL